MHILQHLSIYYPIETPPEIETETIRDEDGSKSHTNYVDLIVEAGFSLYKSNGELLDRVMATESVFYENDLHRQTLLTSDTTNEGTTMEGGH